jgi:predicted porin
MHDIMNEADVRQLVDAASVNVTWDQLATPAFQFVQNSDNNYVNSSLGGGYALSKQDDLYFDYTYFRANNFSDNSALSLPFGADQRQNQMTLTWMRRLSEHLYFTLKYAYATNRDTTTAGLNDFDAHTLYSKVQYKF